LSATADGKRLALLKSTGHGEIYLAELVAEGTRISTPRRLRNQETYDRPTGWTADSKAVLFDSFSNDATGIFKQRIDQDAADLLVTQPQRPVSPTWPRLSPDGAWIVYVEAPTTASAPHRLMRIPVSGGSPQLVLEIHKGLNFECARAPASLCVAFEESQDEKQLTVTLDPVKGRGKTLRTIEKDPSAHLFGSASSPDGLTYAVSKVDEPGIDIRLLSLSPGSDREITVKGWAGLSFMGVEWSGDGKGLYCGSVSLQRCNLALRGYEGDARVLREQKWGGGGSIWGVPSPDGRYLAIEGHVTESNVWMLEGF
jgi:Tol biopolymer transport system component